MGRRAPAAKLAEASLILRLPGFQKMARREGVDMVHAASAAYQLAQERHLQEWRRNCPPFLTIHVVSSGRVVRHVIPAADRAKRKAMDKRRRRKRR